MKFEALFAGTLSGDSVEPQNRVTDMSLEYQDWQPNKIRLTTAEILYRLPDYPMLLQSYVWQKLDTAPQYPNLREFLDFWDKNLDGSIYSVRVAGRDIIGPPPVRHANKSFVLH